MTDEFTLWQKILAMGVLMGCCALLDMGWHQAINGDWHCAFVKCVRLKP